MRYTPESYKRTKGLLSTGFPASQTLVNINRIMCAARHKYGPLPDEVTNATTGNKVGSARRKRMWARRAAVVSRHLIKMAHQNGEQFVAGYVYAITNPAWPNMVKFGKAIDVDDRLNTYQTYSPNRDYQMIAYAFVLNRHDAEERILSKFPDRIGEWVHIESDEAKKLVRGSCDIPNLF